MRFGTRVLLLTLAITVTLSGFVVLVVRQQITRRETEQAHAQIRAAAEGYFQKLEAMHARVDTLVRVLMEDPQHRSLLIDLQEGDQVARQAAGTQFRDEIFGTIVCRELERRGPTPTFQTLLNPAGQLVVACCQDPALGRQLFDETIDWPVAPVLAGPEELHRRYILIGERLYLVLGVPLRIGLNEPPSHAYFVAYRIDDQWVRRQISQDSLAWFMVNGRIIAQGADFGAGISQAISDATGGVRVGEQREIRFRAGGEELRGRAMGFAAAPGVGGVLVVARSWDQVLLPLRRIQRLIVLATCLMVLLAIVAARALSRMLAGPVEQLVRGTRRISRGQFDCPIPVARQDELGELAHSFNEMSHGLMQREIIKDSLGQFVDPRIADALLTDPQSLRGRRLVQTVLFSDLEGFTALGERLEPEKLVEVLNRFLGASADIVKELNGYLDKFVGDGVVAFWGPPVEQNHALAACRAALRVVELARQFTDPPLRVRIGIATGPAIVGIIGSPRSKKNYTAMGDVVNVASRLEGVNKELGTQILIDAATAQALDGAIETRSAGVVQVRGREQAVEVFEVIVEGGGPRSSSGSLEQLRTPSRHV
ncbi:adenylate/guanylate cyclase domain-containing protein [Fontivita pretiosa]|uniref:adenylate/guanylate cyclase domain-containing protein n=1 Tax=Fontivita pretiosa TaxID=2989684 RepID=UPI003D17ABCC